MNRLRLRMLVALGCVLLPRAALACPVCFQNVESVLLDSARAGVLTMVLVTLAVLGVLGRWVLKLRRLSAVKAEADP